LVTPDDLLFFLGGVIWLTVVMAITFSRGATSSKYRSIGTFIYGGEFLSLMFDEKSLDPSVGDLTSDFIKKIRIIKKLLALELVIFVIFLLFFWS
jgi:hypothetical protein